jgi:hypothetical protein
MNKRVQAHGSLTTKSGDVLKVKLTLTVIERRGTTGVEDEEVSRVELASDVQDGDYILEYFYRKPFRESVRVKLGVLTAA